MGKRGAKTKPTALKKLEGNPGKRRLPENEPQPVKRIPDPPEVLTGPALAEWNRKTVQLYNMGVFTEVDGTVLALYCAAYGRWFEAEKELAASGGPVIETTNGNIVHNPHAAVVNKQIDYMLKLAQQFGMTPSSRTGLEANPPDTGKKGGIEEFLYGEKKPGLKVS